MLNFGGGETAGVCALAKGKCMTTTWMLNAAGLFLTTAGVLLMYLHLRQTPGLSDAATVTEVRRAYEKDRRLLLIGVGLVAAWCVVHYLGVLI